MTSDKVKFDKYEIECEMGTVRIFRGGEVVAVDPIFLKLFISIVYSTLELNQKLTEAEAKIKELEKEQILHIDLLAEGYEKEIEQLQTALKVSETRLGEAEGIILASTHIVSSVVEYLFHLKDEYSEAAYENLSKVATDLQQYKEKQLAAITAESLKE